MRGALSFCLLAFFYLLWTPFDKASDLPVIKDSEAAQFVGQNVEVQGLVVAVTTSRKGNTFINFGVPYPNQTFTRWIPPGSTLAADPWVQSLRGKVIGISGTVQLYKGKAEIRVSDRAQIKER
jgi:hypothetical protein